VLKEFGSDQYQGFLRSHPLPVAQFHRLLSEAALPAPRPAGA
jgi:EAL domain-containing protein (putative c-di-GMP-specific phosphodiesterase class I)